MQEATNYSFRTVISGFHKGDVSAYIAKLAKDHASQIDALNQQISALEQENNNLRQMLLDSQQAQPLPEEAELPDLASEEIPEPEEPVADLQEQELIAYRRAEAMERLANQRARKLYGDMQGICSRSAQQAEASETTAQQALEAITSQLEVIRISMTALQDGLHVSSEELKAMGQLIPDPAEGLEEDQWES